MQHFYTCINATSSTPALSLKDQGRMYVCKFQHTIKLTETTLHNQVAKPSDFGMKFTEKTLITKDNVKVQTYTMVLEDENVARTAPTILYFHVRVWQTSNIKWDYLQRAYGFI